MSRTAKLRRRVWWWLEDLVGHLPGRWWLEDWLDRRRTLRNTPGPDSVMTGVAFDVTEDGIGPLRRFGDDDSAKYEGT